jgi:hypothetical protein
MKTAERIPLPGLHRALPRRGSPCSYLTFSASGTAQSQRARPATMLARSPTRRASLLHFVPEESPDVVVERVLKLVHRTA